MPTSIKTLLGLVVLNHNFIKKSRVFVYLRCSFALLFCIACVVPLHCFFVLLVLLLVCHIVCAITGLLHRWW